MSAEQIVGFLELGPRTSGPVRFGRMTADLVEAHTPWEVVRVVVNPDSLRPRWGPLRQAARQLEDVAIAHLQYAPRVWGGGRRQLGSVHAFTRRLAPPLVATVHDVVAELPPSTRLALRLLARRAASLVVASETERERLVGLGVGAPVEVVPHFVERRSSLMAQTDAKAALGLGDRRVVTVLGYIHHRKGHDIAVDALRHLSEGTILVFAGAGVRQGEAYVEAIQERIRSRGLADRVRVTGYLTEPELDTYLAATDVGLLPFRDAAASGSLATWLAAGRPLVGSDIPLLREYRELAPSLIRLAPVGDEGALAEAVEKTRRSPEIEEQAARLADRFSPGNTAARLARLYHHHATR